MDEQCIQILNKGSEQDVIIYLQEFTKKVCSQEAAITVSLLQSLWQIRMFIFGAWLTFKPNGLF